MRHLFVIGVLLVQGIRFRFYVYIWEIHLMTLLSPLAQLSWVSLWEDIHAVCFLKGLLVRAAHARSWWLCVSRSGLHQILIVKIDIKFNFSVCAVYSVNRMVNCWKCFCFLVHILFIQQESVDVCVSVWYCSFTAFKVWDRTERWKTLSVCDPGSLQYIWV